MKKQDSAEGTSPATMNCGYDLLRALDIVDEIQTAKGLTGGRTRATSLGKLPSCVWLVAVLVVCWAAPCAGNCLSETEDYTAPCAGNSLSETEDYRVCMQNVSSCTRLYQWGQNLTGTLPTELGTLTEMTFFSCLQVVKQELSDWHVAHGAGPTLKIKRPSGIGQQLPDGHDTHTTGTAHLSEKMGPVQQQPHRRASHRAGRASAADGIGCRV